MFVNHKRTLYVGGLDEEVNEKILTAAFVPFGDLVDVQIPRAHDTGVSRGFAFVEFDTIEDAADAIDNMHESELMGRTITVNIAKPQGAKEGSTRPIWADDDWLLRHAGETLEKPGVEAEEQEEEVAVEESQDIEMDEGVHCD